MTHDLVIILPVQKLNQILGKSSDTRTDLYFKIENLTKWRNFYWVKLILDTQVNSQHTQSTDTRTTYKTKAAKFLEDFC